MGSPQQGSGLVSEDPADGTSEGTAATDRLVPEIVQ